MPTIMFSVLKSGSAGINTPLLKESEHEIQQRHTPTNLLGIIADAVMNSDFFWLQIVPVLRKIRVQKRKLAPPVHVQDCRVSEFFCSLSGVFGSTGVVAVRAVVDRWVNPSWKRGVRQRVRPIQWIRIRYYR